MDKVKSFRYREEFGLNELMMGNYKFVDGELYAFGPERKELGRNLYGPFMEINENYDSGSYTYYTSVYVIEEHCFIIDLVCLNKGWVLLK